MSWPRRITALGGGRGEGEGEAPESACLCLTTSGGTATVDNPTGGSRCFCTTVSGGSASVQVGCVCRTVSGGAANAQVLCRCATRSGGTATMNNAPAAFANGYAARRRVVLEAMPDLPAETLADFPQPIPGALLAGLLKDAAHAGRVQSSAGWDIRVETGGDNPSGTGGAKLDHHVAAYDPAAGTPFLFARHQRRSAVREVLFVYYGKAGLSASEANPAGTWVAAAAARFWPSGADVTGHGLSFATLSGITTAGVTIAGLPGARMVAASYARLNLVAGGILNGIGAVTTHYLAKFASPFPNDGNGERVGGTAAGTADFSQFVASGVFNSGWIPEDASGNRGGQNNSVALNTPGDVDAGNIHSWHFTNQSGQNSHIWRDGVQLATTFSGGGNDHTAGTIGIDGTENDSLGAGTGAQTAAIPGDYGPSVLYSKVPSRTWIAAYDRCLLDPLAWMGVGAEELPGDAAGSPVAMPVPATVTAGAQSDIDVTSPAFVPAGATAPVLSTVGTAADGGGPAHGSVSAASGKARLLESAAYSGADRFGFTLSASGKLLVPARSIVTVQPVVVAGKAPFYVPNLSGLAPQVITSESDLTAWFNGGNYATKYAYVGTGVSLSARTVSSTNGASKAHPCYVIAARSAGSPPWSSAQNEDFSPRASVTNLTLNAPFVWYDGFVHKPGAAACVTIVGSDSFVTRGWIRRTVGAHGVAVDTHPSPRTRIGCNLFDSDGGAGSTADISQYFKQVPANNPDYWDTYGNAHVAILAADQTSGMCLYAQPGYDSGNPAISPPTELDLSQPHSFWRGCHIRTNTHFGVYAKHIPNFVECDAAFADGTGSISGHSHVFAFRGGSSVGGRMLYLRAQCLPFTKGATSGNRQAFALQSWYHEIGWSEAVGGVINVYAFCPQHDANGNPVYNVNPGDGYKPLQQARYCDVHHTKGLLCLGAIRTDSTFGPEGKLQNVVVAEHEGEIVDVAGRTVAFDGRAGHGNITSTGHTWIETSGPNACKIFDVDPQGRPARPASLSIPRSQAGPGCPTTTPWDGVGQWPKIEDYGSAPWS